LPDSVPSNLEVRGVEIAYRRQAGKTPGLVWLGGYKSNMLGNKAEALASYCKTRHRAFVRFDYSGHGESGGAFADGTISSWVAQSLAVLRAESTGPQILVGSSMGAWIALRMVEDLHKAGEGDRVAGLVLIAPAPDFTVELVEPILTKRQKKSLAEAGFFEVPSEYSDEPYIYTHALIEDGRANRVLDKPIDTHCPVLILHGLNDEAIPTSHVLKLASLLPADDVTVSLIPDGDHRLSRPQDIDMLLAGIDEMIRRIEPDRDES
jgi:pimeloyl-ACP methyl ester carboxylesterase